MFAKLLKHEFLATWRMLAIMTGGFFLVSFSMLLGSLSSSRTLALVGQFISSAGFSFWGMFIAVWLLVNYWRTMYAGPGYLTHSLPVRGRVIFAAKAVYSCCVALVAMTLGYTLALTLPPMAAGMTLTEIWHLTLGGLAPGQRWMLAGIVVLFCSVYVIYLGAISIGTRGPLWRLGAGGAAIGAIASYILIGVVAVITMLAIPLSIRLSGAQAGTLTWEYMTGVAKSQVQDGVPMVTLGAPDLLGVAWFPAVILLSVVYAVIAIRSIERHTSLVNV